MSQAAEDGGDGWVADEEDEAEEQHDGGDGHAFSGGLGFGLGFGEFGGAEAVGFGGDGGADLGAFVAGERDRRGELDEGGDAEFVTELAEGVPDGVALDLGDVDGAAEEPEAPAVADAGCFDEGG